MGHRYAHAPLVECIWALRANTTAYDAAYLVAEALGVTLGTCDARLAATPGHDAIVEVLA